MAKKSTIRQTRYDNEHSIRYNIKLHKENDKDIINAIDPNNKQGSIKALLRKAIKDSN